MVDTSRTFFAVQRACGKVMLGKHLLCSAGKPRDSVPCHPSTPSPNVPWCCSCRHWVGRSGGGLIRSQLAALLMRESHRCLRGQESGMSSLVLLGGFRAGGFAATSCLRIRRFQTSFQRDWKGFSVVQPSCLNSHFELGLEEKVSAGVEVKGGGDMSRGAGCSDVAFASTLSLLCHENIMENSFISAISGSPSVSHTGHV